MNTDKHFNNEVPEIDAMAGIECYCTDFVGTRGSIKHNSEGFVVSEIIDQSALKNIAKTPDPSHRYPVYVLKKKDIDSNHAVFEIEREYGLKLRVLGIKDARASTLQYAGGMDMRGGDRSMQFPAEIKTRHCQLTLQGYGKRPIAKDLLLGNEFTITIFGANSTDITPFISQVGKIANFYGLQRFGSERLVTHLVGRELVKRHFKDAVELILTYTTKYDTAMSKEIRILSADRANFPRLLREIPSGMDIERQVISALLAGKDHISALRAIPLAIRRIYVQAYQAYIFNQCLSRSVKSGESLLDANEGDLCFEMQGPYTFGRIRKYSRDENVKTVPAVRMAGYTFQPGRGRFEIITNDLLLQEGITPRDFYIKEMQELSQQGGFRQAPLWCRDLTYTKSPLVLSFRLPKGSYATTLLRELIRPEDPIESGF